MLWGLLIQNAGTIAWSSRLWRKLVSTSPPMRMTKDSGSFWRICFNFGLGTRFYLKSGFPHLTYKQQTNVNWLELLIVPYSTTYLNLLSALTTKTGKLPRSIEILSPVSSSEIEMTGLWKISWSSRRFLNPRVRTRGKGRESWVSSRNLENAFYVSWRWLY